MSGERNTARVSYRRRMSHAKTEPHPAPHDAGPILGATAVDQVDQTQNDLDDFDESSGLDPDEGPDSNDAGGIDELVSVFEECDDLDDAEASDLDPEIHLADLDEAAADDPSTPEIDVSDMLAPESEYELASEETGPADFDAAHGIDLVDERGDDDDDQGAAEPMADLIETRLPSLDDDDGEGPSDAAPIEWLASIDEEVSPAPADPAWREDRLRRGPSFRGWTIERVGARLLAAGTSLVSAAPASSTPIGPLPRSPIVSMTAISRDELCCATLAGDLFRQPLDGGNPQPIRGWRPKAGLGRDAPIGIRLATAGDGRIFLGTSSGTLLSTHDCRLWIVEPIEGKLVGLEPRARYAVARSRHLVVYRREGRTWHLAGSLAAPAAGAPKREGLIVADEHRVALVDAPTRLMLSSDEGCSFEPVCLGGVLTAVALGVSDSAPVTFVAAHRETAGRSEIILIDARGKRHRIASIDAETADDDAADEVVVETLFWDPPTESLYATGSFGLLRIHRASQSP